MHLHSDRAAGLGAVCAPAPSVALLHSHPHNSGNKTALCRLLLRPLDAGRQELRTQV